jgi:hypothetical protein
MSPNITSASYEALSPWAVAAPPMLISNSVAIISGGSIGIILNKTLFQQSKIRKENFQ